VFHKLVKPKRRVKILFTSWLAVKKVVELSKEWKINEKCFEITKRKLRNSAVHDWNLKHEKIAIGTDKNNNKTVDKFLKALAIDDLIRSFLNLLKR
jgi:hypothetical protein